MQRKDIKVGDRLALVRWRGSAPVEVEVLDRETPLYGSMTGLTVRQPDGTTTSCEAGQLFPLEQIERLGTNARQRAIELAERLKALGFRQNVPKGFRIKKGSSRPAFIIDWEILEYLLNAAEERAEGLPGALEDLLD